MEEIHKKDAFLSKFPRPQKLKTGLSYVPSRFCFFCAARDRKLVFNTLTKQCFALPDDLDINGSFPSEAVEKDKNLYQLMEGRFLVPDGTDECSVYNKLITLTQAYKTASGRQHFTILPTLCCNARCVYCYEEGEKATSMSLETADGTVDFILRTRNKDASICLLWFGGEPLARPDIIDRICEGLENRGVDFYSNMVSIGKHGRRKRVGRHNR